MTVMNSGDQEKYENKCDELNSTIVRVVMDVKSVPLLLASIRHRKYTTL